MNVEIIAEAAMALAMGLYLSTAALVSGDREALCMELAGTYTPITNGASFATYPGDDCADGKWAGLLGYEKEPR